MSTVAEKGRGAPHRAGLAALLDDVPETVSAPAADPEEIRKVSEEAGFPSRAPSKKKQTQARKTRSKAVPAPSNEGEIPAEEVEARVEARRRGRRSEGPKVQFNTRIAAENFAKVDRLRDDTGMTFGQIVERGIDLVDAEFRGTKG